MVSRSQARRLAPGVTTGRSDDSLREASTREGRLGGCTREGSGEARGGARGGSAGSAAQGAPAGFWVPIGERGRTCRFRW